MATHGDDIEKKNLKNIQPIVYLLKWLSETEYENANQQVWLCEHLRGLCAANIQNKMLCCSSGLILKIVETLKMAHNRLDGKSAVELLLLLKSLGKSLNDILESLYRNCNLMKWHVFHHQRDVLLRAKYFWYLLR